MAKTNTAKKLIPITEKELIDTINREGLGAGHFYESKLNIITASHEEKQMLVPGTIGISIAEDGEYCVTYVIGDDHGIMDYSIHNTKEEGYASVLEWYREFAHEEFRDRNPQELMDEYDHLKADEEKCRRVIFRWLGDTKLLDEYDKSNNKAHQKAVRDEIIKKLEECVEQHKRTPVRPSFNYGPVTSYEIMMAEKDNDNLEQALSETAQKGRIKM